MHQTKVPLSLVQVEFNRVLEHAIRLGVDAPAFLRDWQEGNWEGCKEFDFEPADFMLKADALQAQAQAARDLASSLHFFKSRCDALQACQSSMRDPERTMVCDILANGFLLTNGKGELAPERYSIKAETPAAPPTAQADEEGSEKSPAEQRLLELLEHKDEKISELQQELDRAEQTMRFGVDWMLHERSRNDVDELPAPRLQMNLVDNGDFSVESVIALVYREPDGTLCRVPLEYSKRSGGGVDVQSFPTEGALSRQFSGQLPRLAVDLMMLHASMGLPAYVVLDEEHRYLVQDKDFVAVQSVDVATASPASEPPQLSGEEKPLSLRALQVLDMCVPLGSDVTADYELVRADLRAICGKGDVESFAGWTDVLKNAARYQWLREASLDRQGVRVVVDEYPRFLERLDQAIDEAIQTDAEREAAKRTNP